MARVTRILIATVAALATATACSGNDGASSSADEASDSHAGASKGEDTPQSGAASENSAEGSGEGDAESLVNAALESAANRDIIHTVTLYVQTDDVTGAATKAANIALVSGGFIANETSYGQGDSRLTLRIPVDAHTDAVSDLESLGKVIERSRTAEDVTDQVVDTESRIASQQASIARTRQLLETATDIDQIIRIESELSSRESDLDALLRTREELAGLSDLATIEVTFSTPGEADETEEASGFLAGLRNGWDAFTGALTAGATILGALLPFLITLGIIALPVLWWRRHRRPVAPPAAEAPSA